ncbi:hypothetical protein E2C01_075202 [Portunus trituberculatus]|uniref:Uncharacterized protein n=1 Tax=Portunus trituberculatus TaxID=210409 RepID=A0A5B7IIJ0_PORTR|nr:hypothetical protein [Portunus trituberculatus]
MHSQAVGGVAGLLKADAFLQLEDEAFVELATRVRNLSEAEDFPQHHAKGPNITLRGEHPVPQTLHSQPFHWHGTLPHNKTCAVYSYSYPTAEGSNSVGDRGNTPR